MAVTSFSAHKGTIEMSDLNFSPRLYKRFLTVFSNSAVVKLFLQAASFRVFDRGGVVTVAHKGKAQLNIELDTQQSFVIQNNFSRYTKIFRDTKQFFTEHNNLS